MTRDEKKHETIKQALSQILGPDNVSDDKAVMQAYTRDFLPPRNSRPCTASVCCSSWGYA